MICLKSVLSHLECQVVGIPVDVKGYDIEIDHDFLQVNGANRDFLVAVHNSVFIV